MNTDGKITLKIATPAGVFEGTFDGFLNVDEVIEIIVKSKNLVQGDSFELAYNGETLAPDSKIGSFNFPEGAVLDLIASGSAV